MTFRYRGFDAEGKPSRGYVEAENADEAIIRLKERGIYAERVEPWRPLFLRAAPPALMISLAHGLGLYLKAGVTLPAALRLLMENHAPQSAPGRFLAAVLQAIESGRGFDEALAQQRVYRVDPFFLQTVRVAQQGGALAEVLPQLADYIKEQERIRREIVKALIYPAFILVVAVGIVNFMLVAIIPKIVEMFASTGSELPLSTRITLGLSHFFQNHWPSMLVVTVAAAVLPWLLRRRFEGFALGWDRVMLRLPFLGTMFRIRELARFARVMALLMRSGVPFAVALDHAAKTVENRWLRGRFEAVAARVVEGHGFTRAVRESLPKGTVPADFVSAVALGEQSGHLPESLDSLAQLYEQKNRERIEIALALMEPVMMLAIGGLIGFLVISMLLPIFSISIEG